MYAFKNKERLKIICEEDIQSHLIQDEGILQIEEGCSVETDSIKLVGRKISLSEYLMKRIPSVLPAININFDKLVNNSKHVLVFKLGDTSPIETQINNMK